jgi:hypothetical protein
MRRNRGWLLVGSAAGVAAAAAAAYGLLVRPRHLSWGATREEIEKSLPFDGLVAGPNYFATRALTIDASREEVWPFLMDMSALPSGTIVRHVTENETVVFAPPEQEAEATWVVVLESLPEGETRLISRTRARFGRNPAAVLRYLLVDPALFAFERRWLLRIKRSAEDLARAMRTPAEVVAEEKAIDEVAAREDAEAPALT